MKIRIKRILFKLAIKILNRLEYHVIYYHSNEHPMGSAIFASCCQLHATKGLRKFKDIIEGHGLDI